MRDSGLVSTGPNWPKSTAGIVGTPPRGDPARLASEDSLDEGLHVIVSDAVLKSGAGNPGQIDAEFARELSHRGSGVRARESGSLIGGSSWRAGAGAAALSAAAEGGWAGGASGLAAGGLGAGGAVPGTSGGGASCALVAGSIAGPSPLATPSPSARTVAIRSPVETLPPLLTGPFPPRPPQLTARPSSPCRFRA